MSEKITMLQIDSDPFKDGELSITHILDDEVIDMGNIFHKQTKIRFSKTIEQDATGIIPTEIIKYVDSSLLLPVGSQENSLGTHASTPTYSSQTIFNSFHEGESLEELNTALFYTASSDAFEKRNIVFDSATELMGSPQADLSKIPFYNSLYLTYPDDDEGVLVKKLKQGSYEFGTYERMMVLVGQYRDAIANITNSEDLNLSTIIDNYDFPVPVDAYYLFSNASNTLEYGQLEQIVFSQLRKTISKETLWYADIIDEKKTHSEYLFFRVEKWFSSTTTGTPDQVFFIPATGTNKLFIDTQINQNLYYSYRVKAYYAVVEQEYFFSNVIDEGTFGECIVQVRPTIKIDSTDVTEYTLLNAPAPPLCPFVSFHNKESLDNKIKIYMELQKGEEMTPAQQLSFQINQIPSQFITPNDGVHYKYTTQRPQFKIFRLSKKPTSYEDFSEGLLGSFENDDITQSMVVLDNIQANKKYYYMFLTYNDYGSYSNPSPVYEVELIKDADETSVSVNGVMLGPSDDAVLPGGKTINFKSLLNLDVASPQLDFDLEAVRELDDSIVTFENNLDLVTLGESINNGTTVVENKVWGRKFKFRIRSNDSGKVIDLNIKVNLKRQLSQSELQQMSSGLSTSVQAPATTSVS